MGVTGPEFMADLDDLHIIGAMDLPMIAYTYAVVNNAVAGTADHQASAFETSEGGTPSRITGAWPDLRDQLQNILGRSAQHLHSAGATVLHIAQAYADSDTESASILRKVWESGLSRGAVGSERTPGEPPAFKIA
jgi:hypothetical protein